MNRKIPIRLMRSKKGIFLFLVSLLVIGISGFFAETFADWRNVLSRLQPFLFVWRLVLYVTVIALLVTLRQRRLIPAELSGRLTLWFIALVAINEYSNALQFAGG